MTIISLTRERRISNDDESLKFSHFHLHLHAAVLTVIYNPPMCVRMGG